MSPITTTSWALPFGAPDNDRLLLSAVIPLSYVTYVVPLKPNVVLSFKASRSLLERFSTISFVRLDVTFVVTSVKLEKRKISASENTVCCVCKAILE